MKWNRTIIGLVAVCLAVALLPARVNAWTSKPLINLRDSNIVERCLLKGVTAEQVPVNGQPALEVRFGKGKGWSGVRFESDRVLKLSNWSDFQVLTLTVSTPDSKPASVRVRILESVNGKSKTYPFGSFEIVPGRKINIHLGLNTGIVDGMRGQPRYIFGRGERISWPSNWWKLPSCMHVTSLQLYTDKAPSSQTVRIHRIDLRRMDAAEIKPFVDRYGQFTGEDWPGKIHRKEDFRERLRQEIAGLKARPALPGRSRYGGWAEGPKLEATGRFRVAKHEGKWWFVDPEGYLFWSSGITGLKAESGGPIRGGVHCYEWLPKSGDPLAKYYRKNRSVDFFKMNLHRKYGPDFLNSFALISTRRLASWGFNTIGNWSDPETWHKQHVPYTIPVGYRCPNFKIPIHAHKTKYFPDIFSEEFAPAVGEGLKRYAEYKDDPWLLGVFIDNELLWNKAPRLALADTTGSATQKAVIEWIQERFGAIDALNKSWTTGFASWEELRKGVAISDAQAKAAAKDFNAMQSFMAARYYAVCREQVDRHMPGCLYFGSRFSVFTESIVSECAKHADVVCFNIYEDLPNQRKADELATELDFPVIIGEYHFGALDRGMFHTGLRSAKDQDQRAEKFAAYLRAAIKAPWCVGAHWFQFRDQALTGRGDGENYNIGFVTITDTPYPEMTKAAQEVHEELYRLRSSPNNSGDN